MNLSEDYYLESQIVNSNCSKIWFEYGKKQDALSPLWEGRGRSKTPYPHYERAGGEARRPIPTQSASPSAPQGKQCLISYFLASFGA